MAFAPSNNPTAKLWEPLGKPVPVDGELELMRSGMADLVELLSYARPHRSQGELTFIKEWLLPRLSALSVEPEIDDFGNIWADVPMPSLEYGPSFIWSCHVDTVHKPSCTRQAVRWAEDGRTLELVKRKAGRCLGADDGAGVWLLLRMIGARVPGRYVFHRGEEVGRLGSIWVRDNTPEKLKGFDAVVAFDRREYADLITHQMGERCASEAFADTFADALKATGNGTRYIADPTGSFTDSYTYAGLVSECANLSVGYSGEHGPRETLDALHLWRLMQSVISADFGAVVCERDCTVTEWDDWQYGGYSNGYSRGWASGGREGSGASPSSMRERMDAQAWGDDFREAEEGEVLLEMLRRFPLAVVELLGLYGLGAEEIADHLTPLELGQATSAGLISVYPDAKRIGGGWGQD